MQRLQFPIAVLATSLTLVVVVAALAVFLAPRVLAGGAPGGPPWAGAWHGGRDGNWHGKVGDLSPELAGLRDIPAEQRFAHFTGARISLTDRDGRPVTVEITPGTATSVTPTSLTVAANDGATRSFALDDRTTVRGKEAPAQNDRVAVVTLDGGGTARAVFVLTGDRGGPWGPHFGRGR